MIDKVIAALQNSDIKFENLYEAEHTQVSSYLRKQFGENAHIGVDSGISKLVILIKGEDKVIKIPYSMLFDEESYNDDCSYWDSGENENAEEPFPEDYLQKFFCACSDEIETSNEWDYCALECAIYKQAEAEDLAQYFAKEELYAMIKDYPVYVQQRVVPMDCDRLSRLSECDSTRKRCTQLNVKCFNDLWISDFFNYYGESEFVRLSQFLEKHHIYDLHEGNLGYYCGAPILLDYSDFNEW